MLNPHTCKLINKLALTMYDLLLDKKETPLFQS